MNIFTFIPVKLTLPLSRSDRSLLTDEDIQLLHDGAVVEHTTQQFH